MIFRRNGLTSLGELLEGTLEDAPLVFDLSVDDAAFGFDDAAAGGESLFFFDDEYLYLLEDGADFFFFSVEDFFVLFADVDFDFTALRSGKKSFEDDVDYHFGIGLELCSDDFLGCLEGEREDFFVHLVPNIAHQLVEVEDFLI